MKGEPFAFIKPEHRAIAAALAGMDAARLAACKCWFGGGTAIVLELGEYRLSKDVDFLCADQDGYRELRTLLATQGAGGLFGPSVTQERAFRADQYGIRGVIAAQGVPLRFEIVREARITLDGAPHPCVPVMGLSAVDQAAEKLLANADRCRDPSTSLRDAVDLGMLAARRGPLPLQAVAKAVQAYGEEVIAQARWAAARLSAPAKNRHVAEALGMAPRDVEEAAAALRRACRTWPRPASRQGR